MRLIDVEAAIKFVKKYTPCINGETTMDCVVRSLRNVPTIEAKPVVHAHNTRAESPSLFECSACGWYDDDTYTAETAIYNCCPHCGAQMDEEVKE